MLQKKGGSSYLGDFYAKLFVFKIEVTQTHTHTHYDSIFEDEQSTLAWQFQGIVSAALGLKSLDTTFGQKALAVLKEAHIRQTLL